MTLSEAFYSRSTIDVAVDLIGKVLVRKFDTGQASGMIVETEAYVGPHDLACHASKGRTSRTEVLFGPPGRAYVFMIYGVHCCFNAVTEKEGYPAAVLIRAIEPINGRELMKRNRTRAVRDVDIGSGPGKLCQAMGVDRSLNAVNLSGRTIWIEDRKLDPGQIAASPRIGVDYAGEYRDKPWRFFASDSPHVSRHRFNTARSRALGSTREVLEETHDANR